MLPARYDDDDDSPANVSEENEIVTFYEDLSSLVRSIPKHNLLVIGGDRNAQIGKNRNNKYSLHNASNRNGQHLIDFMIENRLTCLNTNFQKREGKLWTYTYPNKSKAQIDYVLINIIIMSRRACADIPDRLSPFLPIIHRLRQVFRITTRVLT